MWTDRGGLLREQERVFIAERAEIPRFPSCPVLLPEPRPNMRTREEIQRDIRQTEDRLRQLKVELASTPPPSEQTRPAHELSPQEYKRYGRQMILNAVGLPGTYNSALQT